MEDYHERGKVIRARSLKRGKIEERITNRIKLEKVLGVTLSSNAALDTDNNGIVAYPAGCTVVLFNTRTEQQNHIINTSKKAVTALAYSSCGRYIVTGECGHQPAVRVWDLQSEPQSAHPGLVPQPQQVAEFLGHKHGIICVAFSPTNKYVVSIGTQHDMIVNVWDWKNNIKIASNKVSTKVKAIAFAENGSYFVTVGNRHVKFWFLDHGKSKYKEAVPLMGRSAILGEQRNNYFCDVACGKAQCGDSTYAITRSGLLCEFNNRRLLDKWVELRTTSANCISVGEKYIFVGCAEGIIRCFDPATLRFITTLPRCHYLGVDVALGTNIQHMAHPPPDAKYPDTVAITYDETNNKLTSVYNDHSIYTWDVFNIKRVGKSCSFLYHSACIWGVEMAPPNSPLPPGSFLTSSSDDTIRVWSIDKMEERSSSEMYQSNIYSNELFKVIYVDKDLSYIKDLDISATSHEKQSDQTSYDGKNGVRCLKVSPDGRQLASGDRSGNIRIHDIATSRELCKIEAHDGEVLCLEYSGTESNNSLLASASRDRLIHVFDTKRGYDFVQTLDDHSASITAVKFLNHSGNVQMVSCGADKSLIFRSLGDFGGKVQFTRDHNATGKTTLYDMEVDTGQKHVLTACQDRNVRIYNVNTGKHTRTFKGSVGDDGTLIKVVLDRSGIYLATSCTDKSLSVYDYYSSECMATMCGHSELSTGLTFTNDCRRLISASGDGCIFVWRLPHDMVITMHARLSQQAMRQGKPLENEIFNDSTNYYFYEDNIGVDAKYRFSIGQLPQWAKKQLTEDTNQPPSLTKGVAAPKGRWAQRAENTMGVKPFYQNNQAPFPSPGSPEKRFDSDGSKDSSLDSGTEVKQYTENRRETVTISKLSANITTRDKSRRNVMTDDSAIGETESTAHDGDIDSDNDYRHKPMYYPLVDSPSGSEFTVTNIDADELRKSQRKKKGPQIVIQQPSTYGSNDSEDDEDDASTPSGENTDRNPMSLFSVSSESLDQLVNREKYLQSTFESMSGIEAESTPTNKSSISAKFLTGSANRNLEAINAVKQTKSDPEAIKKRQELNKRIAETKKKLESVGHSSPLKYSQSIHDLSHIPERDKWSKKQGNHCCACDVNSCFCDLNTNNFIQPNITINIPCCTNDQTNTDCSYFSDKFTENVTNDSQFDSIEYSSSNDLSLPSSISVPTDLQLCGCYMKDIAKNTSQLNHILNFNASSITSTSDTISSFRQSLAGISKSPEKALNDIIRPRKLKLDKTLTKYKLHKSLPVSPVSEERSFSDYVESTNNLKTCSIGRQSFSYFIDLEEKTTDESFKQVCSDIEKFSKDFNKKYEQIEQNFTAEKDENKTGDNMEDDDGNFSSDSLEDYSFLSIGNKKRKKPTPPRRCMSNNEIYRYDQGEFNVEEIPKSESFYLNQHIKSSQDSILSDEQLDYDCMMGKTKSYCNSMESVLSNESDCKSAPLEVLFESQRKYISEVTNISHSQSLPKNISNQLDASLSTSLPKNYTEFSYDPTVYNIDSNTFTRKPETTKTHKANVKTCQTQTDFASPQEIVAKKARGSEDFQKKLLKFESSIAAQHSSNKKPVAFFIETGKKSSNSQSKENVPVKVKTNDEMQMYIPSLASKNKQYKSKFCNVLNNKPEFNMEIFDTGCKGKNIEKHSFTLSKINFEKNTNKNQVQETSSLDRHLFVKSLLNTNEKVTHKPPKAVRRHSSKTRKSKTTYEYIKKEDFYKNNKKDVLNNKKQELLVTDENTIEVNYKEKNIEHELEASCSNTAAFTKNEQHKSSNSILTELYDSLDKKMLSSKMEYDSLEVNLNNQSDGESNNKLYDSLEVNVWSKSSAMTKNTALHLENVLKKQRLSSSRKDLDSDELENVLKNRSSHNKHDDKIAFALENIKILNEIQRKIHKINNLVDIFKKNMCAGKVRALSSMYESLTTSQSFYNDLTKLQATPIKFRRRNLSLPTFMERRLNFESNNLTKDDIKETCIAKEEIKERKGRSKEVYIDESSPDSSLRRSCSLSDLSMQTPTVPKRKIEQVSGKKSQSSSSRSTSRYSKNNVITRSRSSGVLNQSDSDNEGQDKKVSRLMRPTISSHNKINNKTLQGRKKQSYSTSNLNTVGIDNVSTSDDEIETSKKPAAPPRASRQLSFETGPPNVPRRHLNNKATRHSIHFDDTLTNEDLDCSSSESLDLSSIEISNQLCDDVIQQLTKSADDVLKLYTRLSESDDASEAQISKLDRVKLSMIKTHKILHDCIFRDLVQNNGNIDVNQTDTVKKLNDLVSKGCNSTSSVIQIMQQYSDILLEMAQQKIPSANI